MSRGTSAPSNMAVVPDAPRTVYTGASGEAAARHTSTLCVHIDRRPIISAGGPMKYRIALHKSEEGYSVSVPGLPGCWSQGATEQEALENIKDAIREYLSVVNEQLRGADVREVEVVV